jgi:hypothetical protein
VVLQMSGNIISREYFRALFVRLLRWNCAGNFDIGRLVLGLMLWWITVHVHVGQWRDCQVFQPPFGMVPTL